MFKVNLKIIYFSYQALCCEIGEYGKFKIKKWIHDSSDINDVSTESNVILKYLNEKPRNSSKNQEKQRLQQKQNEIKKAKTYVQDKSGALWKFINHILSPDFFNYIFMCDTDNELKIIKRYLYK